MKPTFQDLKELSSRIRFVELRPLSMSSELLADVPENLESQLSVEIEMQQSEDRFSVLGRFSFLGINPSTKDTVVQFKYTALAGYRLNDGAELPPESILRLFAETSSMVHLWPYFRAHVQTTSALLQLPTIPVIPPFRVGDLRKVERKSIKQPLA